MESSARCWVVIDPAVLAVFAALFRPLVQQLLAVWRLVRWRHEFEDELFMAERCVPILFVACHCSIV